MRRGSAIYGPGVPGRLQRLTPFGRRRMRELERRAARTAVQTSPAGASRFGGPADVAWINEGTEVGLAITSAIPPVFAAYATVVIDTDHQSAQGRLLLSRLEQATLQQPWLLGFLHTGAEAAFPDAPRVALYANWPCVLVEVDQQQVLAWCSRPRSGRGALPDLIFPADRSWLLSRLWDDDWRCLGGTEQLVNQVLAEPRLQARRVRLGEDATPPGHVAR